MKHQKHKPCEIEARFSPPLLPVDSLESVLKVPKQGAISRCDETLRFVCQGDGPLRRTVSRQNFYDAESLAKRYGETYH